MSEKQPGNPTTGDSSAAPMPGLSPANAPKPVVPDYELIKPIGRGSYGEVWLGRNATGSYRAVKVVYRNTFEADKPFEREFTGIKEFEPISRSHPAQIDILHVGRNDEAGYFYYVMELADDESAEAQVEVIESAAKRAVGELQQKGSRGSTTSSSVARPIHPDTYAPRTLGSVLRERGRLPVEECLQIALALAEALEHLHAHGLVHRDIKPSNVIFVNGRPKLADIGLVARADATLSFVGTEGYLPPEGPGKPQADIYSLGKVFYEMATGKDRNEFPEPPTSIDHRTQRRMFNEFNEVILKAADHSVERRYRTAHELLMDLQILEAGKSVRRKNAVARLITGTLKAAALLTVLGLVAFLSVTWFAPVPVKGPTYSQPTTVPLNLKLTDLKPNPSLRLYDISPDGSRIIYTDSRKLFLYESKSESTRTVFENQSEILSFTSPIWCGDSETIAVLASTGPASESSPAILHGRISDNEPGTIPLEGVRNVRQLAWRPGGAGFTVAAITPYQLVDIDFNGNTYVWPISLRTRQSRISYSPDGRWICFAGKNSISILKARGAQPIEVSSHYFPEIDPTWADNGTIYFVRNETFGSMQKSRLMRLEIDPDSGFPRGEAVPLPLLRWSQIMHPKAVNQGREIMFLEQTTINWIEVMAGSNPDEVRRIGRGDGPRLSPDGSKVFYIDRTPGEEGLYVKPSVGGARRFILKAAGMVNGGFDISRDGEKIVLAHADEEGHVVVKLLDVASGVGNTIYRSPGPSTEVNELVPRWSPDGGQIAILSGGNTLLLFSRDGLGPPQAIAMPGPGYLAPAWSPSGEQIAFVLYELKDNVDTNYRVEVFTVENRTWRRVSMIENEYAPIEQVQWHPDPDRRQINYFRYSYPDCHRSVFLDRDDNVSLLPDRGSVHDWLGVWAPNGREFFLYTESGDVEAFHESNGRLTSSGIVQGLDDLPFWNLDGSVMGWVDSEVNFEMKVIEILQEP